MKIEPFATEHFYERYEFSSPHLLSTSDCESVPIEELLSLGGSSLQEYGRTTLGYTAASGPPKVREAVAALHGAESADDVLVLNSPIEGIFIAMSALLSSQDRVIVLGPCYDALVNLPRHLSGQVEMWMLQREDGRWSLDWERLDALLEQPTKLLVVNFPHNPTGFLPSQGELDQIVEKCEAKGVWLFADEMYRGLELGGRSRLASPSTRYEKSIVLSGLSKSFGLPGLRYGWLVLPDRAFAKEVLNWKFYTSICPPGSSNALAAAALAATDTLFERNRQRIERHLALATAFFERFGERFTFRPPEAGSVALVGLDAPSATAFCHEVAQKAGVVLLPSAFLGYDDGHVRFGFGRDSFESALSHFERYLESV